MKGQGWKGESRRHSLASKGIETADMDLVYGITRWTNPNRASARHIDDGSGKPLCNSSRKGAWQDQKGEPTCQRCIKIYEGMKEKEGLRILDSEVSNQALVDWNNASDSVDNALRTSVEGVIVGGQTKVDRAFDKRMQDMYAGIWDGDELYDAFAGTRDVLRKKYGDTITLYRLDAPDEEKIPNKHTLNWVYSTGVLEKFKKMYKDYEQDRVLLEREVPIEDIVALNRLGSYEEFIVFNHESEGMILPRNYKKSP